MQIHEALGMLGMDGHKDVRLHLPDELLQVLFARMPRAVRGFEIYYPENYPRCLPRKISGNEPQ